MEEDILKQEEAEMEKRMSAMGNTIPDKYKRVSVLAEMLEKAMQTATMPEIEFPENQKVHGEVNIKGPIEVNEVSVEKLSRSITNALSSVLKFPLVQKITGKVEALVKFPEIQKVTGTIKALVTFPEVQKVSGEVEATVKFPTVQKVEGIVGTDIPRRQLGNMEVVPIAVWDGKGFVNPFGTQTVQSHGGIISAIKEATASNDAGWESVVYAALTNTVQTLPSNARRFGGYYIGNPNATRAYVQVFIDKPSVTLGTTVPDMIFDIPASAAANLELNRGRRATSTIQVAATTTATGSSALGTPLVTTFLYR